MWVVWAAELGPDLAAARYASRVVVSIAPHSDLSSLRNKAIAEAEAAARGGALAAVTGFDPTGWTMVQFRLWRSLPAADADTIQIYAVGHVSLPKQR